MSDETSGESLRERLSRQGEEALGRIAQDLLENPLVSGALQRGFEAREKASQAQEAAMGAHNLPSAADLELWQAGRPRGSPPDLPCARYQRRLPFRW